MSEKKGAERRQHRRFSVVEGMIEPITLQMDSESTSKRQPAILTDLSAGGMSLLMFSEPPHTKRFDMVLAIPGLDRVSIEAAIVHVVRKGETYSVGLSFVKIPREARAKIAQMAEDAADCDTRKSLGLPDACGTDCPFHSLFNRNGKTAKAGRR